MWHLPAQIVWSEKIDKYRNWSRKVVKNIGKKMVGVGKVLYNKLRVVWSSKVTDVFRFCSNICYGQPLHLKFTILFLGFSRLTSELSLNIMGKKMYERCSTIKVNPIMRDKCGVTSHLACMNRTDYPRSNGQFSNCSDVTPPLRLFLSKMIWTNIYTFNFALSLNKISSCCGIEEARRQVCGKNENNYFRTKNWNIQF